MKVFFGVKPHKLKKNCEGYEWHQIRMNKKITCLIDRVQAVLETALISHCTVESNRVIQQALAEYTIFDVCNHHTCFSCTVCSYN